MKKIYRMLFVLSLFFVVSKVNASPSNGLFLDDNLYKCIIDAYNVNAEVKRDYSYNILPEELNEITTLDSATPEYQTKSDELARMTEVINTLEQQHTEYLSRLYVAWTTTPQMRNMVKVSSDMRQKLGMLRRNTIPTMKLSIAQLGILQQSVKSGVTADAIVNANNAALQMLAETSKEAIPMLERTAQSPTVSIQSVTALAESLVEQNNSIIAAIDNGRKQRAQLEAAVVKSAETINDSVKIRDQKIVEALLNEGKESQEEVEKINFTEEK